MKLHLPVLLRKALLACFAFTFACLATSAAADLTLGGDASLTIDYAAANSIPDLAGGTLQLSGDTVLLLSNCGVGDGKTYTLLTGVGALLDAEGNPLTLTDVNNAASLYFDTSRPGSGFWADGWLQLASDGSVQLVLHNETVKGAQTITTRQTGSKTYNYYEDICFRDITHSPNSSTAYGGAISGATITLSNNGSVVFEGNTASSSTDLPYGGAIYGDGRGDITLSNNGSVLFSGNKALSSEVAQGGAIYGDGDITLCNNGSVRFCGNSAFVNQTGLAGSYSPSAYGGAIRSGRYISSGRYITLDNNDCVEFVENEATGVGAMFYGGAIYGNTTLRNNGSVTFRANKALRTSGDVPGPAEGGAIYGSAIALINNESVTFSANISALGGAISGGSTIMLINNGSVAFSENNAVRCGGAIYAYDCNLSIQNNDFVLFERNISHIGKDVYDLCSVYFYSEREHESVATLSAAEGKSIEFRDSIYIDDGCIFNLNADYIYRNEEDVSVAAAQQGDIIFTGATTVDDLFIVKGNVAGTAEEILASRTTEVRTVANLYNGRLIIKEGAIWSGDGIVVAPAAGTSYKPTLLLQNANLTHYEPSGTARNVVTIKSGATLEVAGKNTAHYTSLNLEGGSTLTFNLSAANTSADTAVICMSDSALTLPQSGIVTLQLVAFDGISESQTYALLSGVSMPTNWSSANVTVTSGTAGWAVSFNDLCWKDDTLWLYYNDLPELETATWTNDSGDYKWNTSSINWEQGEIDYEYKDGVDVVFGNAGAGTVTLVGNIAPGSVLVSSTQDYTWVADSAGGKLTGSMALTKQGAGTLHIQTSNDYTGGTVIEGGKLVAGTATALGTGSVVLNGGTLEIGAAGLSNSLSNTGISTLQTSTGITHVLTGIISNSGELTMSGSFDASRLTYETLTSDERYALDGSVVGADKSGFAVGVSYQVKIVDGGTIINDKAAISHRSHAGSNALVLESDGYARANGDGNYSHYYLTNGDAISVGEIAQVAANKNGGLTHVSMDSGSLEVNQSIIVSATGGSLAITNAAVLGGSIADTAVSTAAGNYSAEISALMSGDSALVVNGGEITVSGANSYTGGTQVNGGALVAGNAQAFGSGDVVVNGATLDLNQFSIANKVFMNGNSTLSYADGASHIVLGNGAAVNFRNGYTLGSGKRLTVAGPASYTGALTLGGGTLELGGQLTVQGDVVFASGATTTLDISGWKGLDDGDVLADFGSSNSGYADGSLSLEGIAGDWELAFDAATGILTLLAVKDDPMPEPEPEPMPEPVFAPELNRNQQIVYDTVKDIMGEGKPSGLLGQLGKEVTGTRDEAALKELLDALGGAEYATLMSSQQDAARGHMRRLRGSTGSGYALAGTKTRAYIEAYTNRSDVDGDSSGRGYEMTENGGQFVLEFLGEEKVSGGFAVASGRTKLQPDGGLSQKGDNTYVDAFLVCREGGYTGKTSLGVGVHSYDLERNVMGNAVRAQADGSSVNFMHESAYAMALDESNSVQVFGAVESSMGKLGAFHEKGADTASLQVKGQDAWMTTLSVGARYHYRFAAVDAAPAATLSLQAGVEYKLGDTESEVEMSFSGARRNGFKQSGTKRDTFGYNLGASLHVPVSARAAVYASGDAVLRGDSSEVNANVGVQLAF